MGREIKFRVWDGKKMTFPNDENDLFLLIGDSGYFSVQDHSSENYETADVVNGSKCLDIINALEDDLELMEYIGLKDKKGIDIYESDFVEANGETHLIIWRSDLASFAISKNGWPYDHFFGEAMDAGYCSVVGNKFENPELLTK